MLYLCCKQFHLSLFHKHLQVLLRFLSLSFLQILLTCFYWHGCIVYLSCSYFLLFYNFENETSGLIWLANLDICLIIDLNWGKSFKLLSNYPESNLVPQKVPQNRKWSKIHHHNPESCLLLYQMNIAGLHMHTFPPRLINSLFTFLNQGLRAVFNRHMQHFNFYIMLENEINLRVLKKHILLINKLKQ